jgi:hypothetical protein
MQPKISSNRWIKITALLIVFWGLISPGLPARAANSAQGAVPPTDAVMPDLPRNPAPEAPQMAQANAPAVIDLMVVYTAQSAWDSDSWTYVFPARLDKMTLLGINSAFSASKINARVRMVAQKKVNYDESLTTCATTLARLQNPSDGYMDEVQGWRDQYGADVVLLAIHPPNLCEGGVTGQAYQMTRNDASSQAYAYGYFIAGGPQENVLNTPTHELGHIMGAGHNHEQGCNGLYAYSCGYIFPDKSLRTVMAYWNSTCTPNGCSALDQFSNPGVTFNGIPTGITGYADNALTINQTAPTVAAYRPGKVGSLSGKVIDSNGNAISRAQIYVDGVATDLSFNGEYSIMAPPGNHTVQVVKEGYLFAPDAQPVTVTNADVSLAPFIGTALQMVMGSVKDPQGNGIANVQISLDGGEIQTLTNSVGRYSLFVQPGVHDLYPKIEGYWFQPTSIHFTMATSDIPNQDFVANPIEVNLNQAIGGPGSTFIVTSSGFPPHSTVLVHVGWQPITTVCTDNAGLINFQLLMDIQAKAGNYPLLLRLINPNACTYSAAGRVVDANLVGLAGINLSAGTGLNAVTANLGFYVIPNLSNGSYVIQPLTGTFQPASRNTTVPPASLGQDFQATANSGLAPAALAAAAGVDYDPWVAIQFQIQANGPVLSSGTGLIIGVPPDVAPILSIFLPTIRR